MHHLSRLLGQHRRVCVAGASALLALLCAATARAGAFRNSAHGDRAVLPRGCGSCHVGHGPPQSKMMPASEEAVCLRCHGDPAARSAAQGKGLLTKTVGLANVHAEFLKASRHPLNTVAQPPARSPSRGGAAGPSGRSSAVSCSSCHDSHYMLKAAGAPPGAATQVKQIGGARGTTITEYSLCYRCHGSSAAAGSSGIDIEQLMRPSNPSYHPVHAAGRSSDVPSLIRPYKAQSIIACTDCHGSDQANGPRGPHGSAFAPILKAHFERDSGRPESAYEYALCYRCHSRSVVVSDNPASFQYHKKHIVDAKASCRACHNSHGSEQYSHLIDFDTEVAFSNSKGQLRFHDLGARRGSCSLLCHNKDHDDKRY